MQSDITITHKQVLAVNLADVFMSHIFCHKYCFLFLVCCTETNGKKKSNIYSRKYVT